MMAIHFLSENPNVIIVVTDCRYLDELIALKTLGATAVHIKRDNLPVSDLHSSELELDAYHHLFDYTIENNGTLEEYQEKIIQFIEQELQKENSIKLT